MIGSGCMEYLFRGKSEETNIWSEGDYRRHDRSFGGMSYSYIHGRTLPVCVERVIPSSVGMWSGLTTVGDNPVKVFEGDIIRGHNSLEEFIGVVKFGRFKDLEGIEHIGFSIQWVSGLNIEHIRNDLVWWIEHASAQVIGNTTDNPELLEVDTNG